jgi:hypothetical protein
MRKSGARILMASENSGIGEVLREQKIEDR